MRNNPLVENLSDITLSAPFPYAGGKKRVAAEVWSRLGSDVEVYIEPFCGSAAMLLQNPNGLCKAETLNDLSGYIANFWRAVKFQPDEAAWWADYPVIEADILPRHQWLIDRGDSLLVELQNDPEFCDPKAAGWWAWGQSLWIGDGWCCGTKGNTKLPHLSHQGKGVHKRAATHLPALRDTGMGVHKRASTPISEEGERGIYPWFRTLSERLRDVRVCCGDWSRVVSPSILEPASPSGPAAVFLDPPYAGSAGTYGVGEVAHDVLEWARENGSKYRIALCCYGELDLVGWEFSRWASKGRGQKRTEERIYYSPACVSVSNGVLDLFGE